jgi:hypothetical protein
MKALLFIPQVYSLAEMLADGFHENGWEAKVIDYKSVMPYHLNRFYEKTSGVPGRLAKFCKAAYFKSVNKRYIEIFNEELPDMVMIYNHQFVFPETICQFKKKAKLVFFLGDNPLWSKTFDYNLSILKDADLVISPDSHWQFELTMTGIPNVICDHIGYSKKRFFPVSDITEEIKKSYESDLLFIGRNYPGSSGYKRTMFLSSFAGLNLKVFGTKEWNKWLPYFPSLKPHFYSIPARISHEELNLAINCTKIYPIDQNPGIIHGIHLRIFETIGAGTLPLVEWRKDINTVFGGHLPVIKNYTEAKKIAEDYLKSDDTRTETIRKLRSYIDTKYNPSLYVERILEYLGTNKVISESAVHI